jgi:uncharacterized protein YjbI with pentapeptide repeats
VTKPLINLKPANENPWYVLMTLFGEQEGGKINEELHKKNVDFWNLYMGPLKDTSSMEKLEAHNSKFKIPRGYIDSNADKVKDQFHIQCKERFGDNACWPVMPKIDGIIDLSETCFEKLFSVNNMYFKEKMNFSGSKFMKDASFIECGFVETVDLSKVEIAGNTDFSYSYFFVDFVAKDMTVLGSLVAEKVAVDGGLDLSNVRITGMAILNHLQINGLTTLEKSSFESECDFDDSNFSGVALFRGAVFKGDIGFRSATFVNDAKFGEAQFRGDATFASSIFEKEVSFRMAEFHKHADFPKVQFKGITDFADSKFFTRGKDQRTGIRFTDAIFSKSTSFRQLRLKFQMQHSEPFGHRML